MIRDDKRLISVVTIRQGPDKDSLNVDLFIPGEGKTLSGVMPAGGGELQQVARAIMTVYPVSSLPTDSTEEDKGYDHEGWSMVEIKRAKEILDKREEKLEQDIENFRKSHPDT